jgi:membrane-bound metal-dependent hydrolase YbcI (DUF457 family)
VTTLAAVNALTGFVQPHGVQGLPTGPIICAGAAILGALAPDVDAEDSTIQRDMGPAGSLASLGLRSMGVGHRGLTHYGLTTLLVMLVGYLVGRWLGYPDAGLAFGLGYFSHVAIADAMTRYGVPLWAPLSATRFHLLPRAFRVKTGGPVEALVFLCAGLILAWLAWDMVSTEMLKKLF